MGKDPILGGEAARLDEGLGAAEGIANQVDVLCLAQVSMEMARTAVQARREVPVLTSPATAVARLKGLLDGSRTQFWLRPHRRSAAGSEV